jgi:hypothetical protein
MSHYYKLAFTTFRIFGSLVVIYSLLSSGYVLITARIVTLAKAGLSDGATTPSTVTVIARFLPVLFYLVFGILVFAFSKQLAKLASRESIANSSTTLPYYRLCSLVDNKSRST